MSFQLSGMNINSPLLRGNTLFERITSGTPGATLCQLERQNQIAYNFEEIGCNINLGIWNKVNSSIIK